MIVTTSTQVLKISFKGETIATFSVHFQDILNVQTANMGIETGTAWAAQAQSVSFRLGSET